jgi:hypothetical protein
MFSFRYPALALSAFFFAASLAACAGNSTTVPAAQSLAPQRLAPTVAVPGPCAGQETRHTFASITEALGKRGGRLCIPAIRGFGGSLQYPDAYSSNQAELISSTTDYSKALPTLGTGAPMFYLQLSTSYATTFGKGPTVGGALEGQKIKPGQTYTLYAHATLGDGIPGGSIACYVKANTNAFGGAIGGLGSVFKLATVAGLGYQSFQVVIEVYLGKQVKSKCS